MALSLHAQLPKVSAVTNGASYSPLVSPGAFVAIFGSGFGSSFGSVNTSVAVGGLNAPVYFTSSNQINVQFPEDLRPGPTTLTVTVGGAVSAPVNVNISAYAPALLTADASGTGLGAFTSAADASKRVYGAAPGETIVAYATGLGTPNAASPTVTVDGVAASVRSANFALAVAGVYQVTFVVPRAGPGNRDVVLSIGGVNSPAVSLPVSSGPVTHIQRLNPQPRKSRIPAGTSTLRSPAVPGPAPVRAAPALPTPATLASALRFATR